MIKFIFKLLQTDWFNIRKKAESKKIRDDKDQVCTCTKYDIQCLWKASVIQDSVKITK